MYSPFVVIRILPEIAGGLAVFSRPRFELGNRTTVEPRALGVEMTEHRRAVGGGERVRILPFRRRPSRTGSGYGTGSPTGMSSGLGMSPRSTMRWRVRCSFGSGIGIAERNASVYGCLGAA